MEMRYHWGWQAFAGQRRPAPGAKSSPGFPRRRIKLGYLTFGNRISLAVECHEDRNRRAGVLSTTLAMTPICPLRLAGRDKTDRTTEAATFELLDRAAHNLILPFGLESVSQSQKKTALPTSSVLTGEYAG